MGVLQTHNHADSLSPGCPHSRARVNRGPGIKIVRTARASRGIAEPDKTGLGLDDVGADALLRALKYLVADRLGQLALRGPLGNATEVQARAQVVRHEAEDVDRPAVVFYCQIAVARVTSLRGPWGPGYRPS